MKGKIYNFFPVIANDDAEQSFSAIEEDWQWKIFGWWFEMYTWMRSVTADLMGIEELPFMIKVSKEEFEKYEKTN